MSPSSSLSPPTASAGFTDTDRFTDTEKRRIVLLLAAVQFVNILDFMMVMPLGPDLAVSLGIPTTKLGIVGGTYTASAAISGIVCSFFLDRFDRRPALFFSMLGLFFGTLAGGFAVNLETLLAARIVAGAFGGPATSLAMSIVADVFPPQHRGKALATVMLAFSLASVLGVPVGLELARHFDWRAPFFGVAALGLAIGVLGLKLLPSLTGHLAQQHKATTWGELFSRPVVWLAMLISGLGMLSAFALIPNFSTFFQRNMGFPRDKLGLLYLGGGTVTFAMTRLAGSVIDKVGSVKVASVATAVYATLLLCIFVFTLPVPTWLFFMAFMSASSVRNVAMTNAATRVPRPEERARFMSAQSAIQHMCASAGAFIGTLLLSEGEGQKLIGMSSVALFSTLMALTMPFTVHWLLRSLRTAA